MSDPSAQRTNSGPEVSPEAVVEGLREIAGFDKPLPYTSGRFGLPESVRNTCRLAADLIEKLQADIKRSADSFDRADAEMEADDFLGPERLA